MKSLAIIIFVAGMCALLLTYFQPLENKKAESLAANFLTYRNEVQNYVFKQKLTTDTIIDNSKLNLPSVFVFSRAYKAEIYNNKLFVYFSGSQLEFSVVHRLMNYSKAFEYYNSKKTDYPENIQVNSILSVVSL